MMKQQVAARAWAPSAAGLLLVFPVLVVAAGLRAAEKPPDASSSSSKDDAQSADHSNGVEDTDAELDPRTGKRRGPAKPPCLKGEMMYHPGCGKLTLPEGCYPTIGGGCELDSQCPSGYRCVHAMHNTCYRQMCQECGAVVAFCIPEELAAGLKQPLVFPDDIRMHVWGHVLTDYIFSKQVRFRACLPKNHELIADEKFRSIPINVTVLPGGGIELAHNPQNVLVNTKVEACVDGILRKTAIPDFVAEPWTIQTNFYGFLHKSTPTRAKMRKRTE